MNKKLRFTVTMVAAITLAALLISARYRGTGVYRFESQPRAVLAAGGSSQRPKLAMTTNDTLYMLAVQGYEANGRLVLTMSHDSGDTFMSPVTISGEHARVSWQGEGAPSLVVRGMSVFALWQQRTGEGGAEIMFVRSTKMGHSFDTPLRISDKKQPSFNGFASLGAAPNGDIYAIWLDGRDAPQPAGTFAVYVARSNDGGLTFSKNVRVDMGACPCCRPAITFGANGEVFLAWRKVFAGDIRDIVVVTSTDQGQTFSSAVKAASDDWVLHACPESGPTLVARDNKVYIAWYSAGQNGPGIRLASSSDGAKTFSTAQIVSRGVLDANHPVLSVSEDGRIVLTFQGRDASQKNGWSALQPFISEIASDGNVTTPEPVLTSGYSTSYPDVLSASNGRVFVAWTHAQGSRNDVQLLRGRKRKS